MKKEKAQQEVWDRAQQQSPSSGQENPSMSGSDFEAAADRVTAEVDKAVDDAQSPEAGAIEGAEFKLEIKPEWALYVSKNAFYPLSKFVHPVYALTEEEAWDLNPFMREFLQEVADKYLPAQMSAIAAKYPASFALATAVSLLLLKKVTEVSAARDKEAAADKKTITLVPAVVDGIVQ